MFSTFFNISIVFHHALVHIGAPLIGYSVLLDQAYGACSKISISNRKKVDI